MEKYTGVLALCTVAVVTIVYLLQIRRKRFYQLAAKIPGPPTLPIIGNALDFIHEDNCSLPQVIMELLTKYEGTARVWLGQKLFVFISKPEDIEICLTSSKLIEKNEIYSLFDDMLGQGLFNASGDIWKKHRRIITPTFHMSILKHFVDIFDRNSQCLVKRLESRMHQEINIFPFLRDCALNFITETAMETNIDAQNEVVSATTVATERMMQITSDRLMKIWLHSNTLFYLTRQGREYIQLRKLVQENTTPLLRAKKQEMAEEEKAKRERGTEDFVSERKSFFRLLVNLNENGESFNDSEVRDEVMTIIVTGYETTAATMSFVLVMLGMHADVQNKVYEEVRTLRLRLGDKRPDTHDLQSLVYMDMVIKETLRLYPVGPVIFRKATTDVPLASCTVPKGASVAVVFLQSHRDPALWRNPNAFNPDNFLPENSANRHAYCYNPFSAGPRGCIGQKYAQISMRIMLYYLLSHFCIKCDKKFEDVQISIEVTLKMKDGFNIRLEPRA